MNKHLDIVHGVRYRNYSAHWTSGRTGHEGDGMSGRTEAEQKHADCCMIGLSLLIAGDESRMAGDCCRPEGSIHRCVRTHSHLYSHIYGLVALLDITQSSFSISLL